MCYWEENICKQRVQPSKSLSSILLPITFNKSLCYKRRCYFLPFHFILVFSKNRRVEGNSNFEITISFHFYINFRNCYFLPFWLLFPSSYHLSEIKGVEGNSNFIIAISFHFLLKWVASLRGPFSLQHDFLL